MAWCEDNGVDYIFGLAGNSVLHSPPLIRGGRRPQGAPRRGRRGQDAGLRRVRLRRPLLEPPAPGPSPGWRRPRGASTPATSSPRSVALARETNEDDTAHEMAVTARGLAKAAEILAGQFTLVATNVPYLGRGKQGEELQDYCEKVHANAKADLATCFIERCLSFCASSGTTALVSPQNWFFLGTYEKFRQQLFSIASWNFAVKLGPTAFQKYEFLGVQDWSSRAEPNEAARGFVNLWFRRF